MRKFFFPNNHILFILFLVVFSVSASAQLNPDTGRIKNIKFKGRYDNPDLALAFEIDKTKDPATGKVPRHRLAQANIVAKASKDLVRNTYGRATAAINWIERGSNSDAVGGSNGNTRANGAITSGRMRAVWADLSDATGNTVWVGGVDGGLWKTTNISSTSATWAIINDYLSNLAVTGICQDPTNPAIMYFCTGEAFGNADAVNGNGVYKSTNSGISWTQIASTASYTACTKILCDASGNVYLATYGNGMKRSTNGGSTWADITPTGLSTRIADFEISSTGRLHISCGLGSTSLYGYRFTNNPSGVTTSTWTSATTPFVFPATTRVRAELACSGNVLYAAISNSDSYVQQVSKSIDGGVNWITSNLASTAQVFLNGDGPKSQAWYCLTVGIDPANANNVMIGNLNIISSSDGGASWIKGSEWVGTSGQYVHADQHAILWYDNGNKLLFGTDGGIHFSSDKGATIRDRNTGLRIKQFYSVAIHPTSTNYFLAGAQDNGNHQFNSAGLGPSIEVTGGDGAYVAIDQDQSQYQYGAYVYNAYRRSTNNGLNWGSVNFYKGSSGSASNFGQFINPFDYDNSNNIIYAAGDAGEIFRWTTPQTTASGTYYSSSFPTGATILTGITNLNGNIVSAVKVSPYTSNRVYFGAGSRLIYIDNANTVPSATAGTNITGASFSGTISSIETGTNDQNLIVCFSNYGAASNVWVTSNGGTSWTAIDGNLPDMPVRWALFYPGGNTKAIIATETGIWETELINGASTVWVANPTFPVVRTDMLKYRSSDGTIAAATHGRGLFTSTISACPTPPTINITPGSALYCTPSGTAVTLSASGGLSYNWAPSTGLSSTSGASVTANPTNTTVYTVTGFDANGCSGTANTTITVAASVVAAASATPSQICSGQNSLLNANVTVPSFTYCQPVYTNGTGSGDFISQVTISSTSLNNITTGAASPYYTLYPASGSTTATISANTLYTVTVKGGTFSTCLIRAWIDYNNNGVFSDAESIGISGNVGASTAGTFQFTAPSSAINGTTRLRLRSSDAAPGPAVSDACDETNRPYGETEDYIITISGGTNSFSYLWTPSTFLTSATINPANANAVTSTTNYTVTVTSSAGCSTTSNAAVNIVSVAAPTGTNGSICGPGSVNISASTTAGNTIDWYAASSGGVALLSGSTTYATPSISATTTYYAQARNTTAGCLSPTRTAVVATINAVPSSPTGVAGSRCGTGTVGISSTTTAGHTIDWYAASSGGTAFTSGSTTYTTPVISATTIYYAQARNTTTGCVSAARTAVTATVNAVPASPTGVPGSRCAAGTVNISATTTAGHTIDWYAAASGGTALSTGSTSFTTPSISANTTYYAQARNTTTGCISLSRTAVLATVNTVPAAPTGTGGSRCGTGQVNISASTTAGHTIDWYAASSGGTALSSGSTSFTTPSISANTTYYAEARNSTTACISATRTAVLATVLSTPPVSTATGGSRCGNGTVNLSATTTAVNTIDWYAAPTGGSPLSSGSLTFTTPSLSANTTYYVEARNTTTSCVSSSRTSVFAFVHSFPPVPTISANGPTTFCTGGSVILTSSATSGNSWSNGATTQSITVTSSDNFTVAVSGNPGGCVAVSAVQNVTVTSCSGIVLNLKLFLEGFYTGTSNMRSTLFDAGISSDPLASDSITVNLWSPSNLSNPSAAFSVKGILKKNGTCQLTIPGVSIGTSYYIAVKHRNHIETWTAAPVVFSANTSYDFSTSISQAFGNNMNGISGVFVIYAADLNQDGAVESEDYSKMENDIQLSLFGYYTSDITGDNAVESEDYSLIENNIQKSIFLSRPDNLRMIMRRAFFRKK